MIASLKIAVLAAALGLALLHETEPATATVLRWDLQNVTFDAGGTASGFFLFDADNLQVPSPGSPRSPMLVDWSIEVTGSVLPCEPCLPLFRFTPGNTPFASAGPLFVFLNGPSFYDPVGRNSLRLQLDFDSPLSDAGGTVGLSGGEELIYFGYSRSIVSGQIKAISPKLLRSSFSR
jgi:hypothetical protein